MVKRRTKKEIELSACIRLGYDLSVEKNKRKIENELSNNPFFKKLLADKLTVFVSWASKIRVNYEENLQEEIDDFLNLKFRDIGIRLYNHNIKLWYSISKQVFERDSFTCQYCGKVGGKLEVDHIIPFSKGGSDDLDNLTTSCLRCNRQKKNKSVTEFSIWKKTNNEEKN